MFRKPPTKLEQLQDTLSDTLDAIHETLDGLPLDKVKSARDSAAQNVTHGWEVALRRAGDAVHSAADVLGSAAGTVANRTGPAISAARSSAESAAHVAADRAGQAAELASSRAHDWADRASGFAAAAAARAARIAAQSNSAAHDQVDSAAHTLHDKHDQLLATLEATGKAAKKLGKKKRREAEIAAAAAAASAHQAIESAKSRGRHRAAEIAPQVVVEDSSSKWLWIIMGLLAGAAVALVLVAKRDEEREAQFAEKLRKAKEQATEFGQSAAHNVTNKAGHLKRKAEGMIHEYKSASEPDDADDKTIVDRVRTALGENTATHNLEKLNIDCVDGLVTVRGPLADSALQAQIVAVISAVKGVKSVQSELLLEDAPEDSATFVG